MSLQIEKTSAATQGVVFQAINEVAQGGFTLETSDLVVGNTLKAGTVIGATVANETARRVTVIKTAIIYEAATNTDTTFKIKKGHHFKVGNYIAAVKGGKAYAITGLDTSNAAYDSVTVGTTLAVALAVGDIVFQSTATGATAAVYVRPLGLVANDSIITLEHPVSVVIDGTVYARRVAVPSAVCTDLPKILFSNSY